MPAMSKTQETELFRRSREAGDRNARDALVYAHIALAKKLIAANCRGNRQMLDDLMPDAASVVFEAFERFDVSRGVKFASTIRFSVMNLCTKWRQDRCLIRSPRSLPRELRPRTVSLYSFDGELRTCFDPGYSITGHSVTDLDDVPDRHWLRFAMSKLEPRLQDVIQSRFFKCETLQCIGDRLGVTKQRVRQLQARALAQLRAIHEELSGIEDYAQEFDSATSICLERPWPCRPTDEAKSYSIRMETRIGPVSAEILETLSRSGALTAQDLALKLKKKPHSIKTALTKGRDKLFVRGSDDRWRVVTGFAA